MRVSGNEGSKQTAHTGRPLESKDSKESKESKDVKDVKDAKEVKEARETRRADKVSTADVEKTSTPSVNAEISSKSRELAKVKTAATDAPDIREAKVADLKRRIEEGSYRVDSNAIADRMVDEHLSFPGTR